MSKENNHPAQATGERDESSWKDTAAQYARDCEYYRGLVVRIGKALGEQAYISDDGSKQQDVLCAKVPELVEAALATPPAKGDKLREAEIEKLRTAQRCISCPDVGWYAEGSHEDGWEQVQCEFCYTAENSFFNVAAALSSPVKEGEGRG